MGDQNEIKNSEHQNVINTVLDIIKTTPQKELHGLSKAIEDNPNGLKDLLGMSTSPDPSIVKVVAGIFKTQLAKFVPTDETVTSSGWTLEMSFFLNVYLLYLVYI